MDREGLLRGLICIEIVDVSGTAVLSSPQMQELLRLYISGALYLVGAISWLFIDSVTSLPGTETPDPA